MKREDWLDLILLFKEKDWSDWTLLTISILSTTIMAISTFFAAKSARASKKATDLNVKLYDQQYELLKISLKPDIVIKDKDVEYFCSPSIPDHILSWNNSSSMGKENKSYLTLTNLSKNLAKDVSVLVQIKNYEKAVEILNSTKLNYYERLSLEMSSKKRDPSKKCLYFNYKWRSESDIARGSGEFDLCQFRELLFVNSNEHVSIEIPRSFESLCNLIIIHSIFKVDLPYLEVEIKYKDIIGNYYEEFFIITIKGRYIQIIDEPSQIKAKLLVSRK